MWHSIWSAAGAEAERDARDRFARLLLALAGERNELRVGPDWVAVRLLDEDTVLRSEDRASLPPCEMALRPTMSPPAMVPSDGTRHENAAVENHPWG